MTRRKIRWGMACDVNGQSFEFNGNGWGDEQSGEVTMHFTSTGFPTGFDPVSCPLICNSPLTIGFAKSSSETAALFDICGPELHVSPCRTGSVFDKHNNELAHLAISSQIHCNDDEFIIGNKMRGHSKLPRIKSAQLPATEYIVPNGPGRATATITYNLVTTDGELLTGITTVPYEWSNGRELPHTLKRTYESINVNWTSPRDVHSIVRSSISHVQDLLTGTLPSVQSASEFRAQ